MDRAERKRRQRAIEAWNSRQTFVQHEIIEGNYQAYEVAVGHALDAAASLFGIGEVRVVRFQEKLQLQQKADGIGEGAVRKPEMDKSAAAFDATYKFSKRAALLMNIESYKVAMDHITDAVSIIYNLGPKRMAEFQEALARIQAEDRLADFNQDGNPYALRLRRAERMAFTAMISDQAKAAIDKLVRR
jgi:GH24 family phage-related lysozyme (muramidase)